MYARTKRSQLATLPTVVPPPNVREPRTCAYCPCDAYHESRVNDAAWCARHGMKVRFDQPYCEEMHNLSRIGAHLRKHTPEYRG